MASPAMETAVAEELQEYLAEKKVNNLFVKIVEHLLIDKPDEPVGAIVSYLMASYPEETKEFCKREDVKKQGGKGAGAASSESKEEQKAADDSSSSDSEDEDEGDMVEDLPSLPKKTAVSRRVSVSAGVIDPTKAFEKVVFEKSEEDAKRLKELISKTFVCSQLDDKDLDEVVMSLEKHPVSAGVEVITEGDRVAEHFYILDQGSAEVLKGGAKLDLEYGPGDAFGELALMYNAPRAATIKTLEDCEFWRLDQGSFKRIVMGAAIKKREKYSAFLETVQIFGEMDPQERMVLADALLERKYGKDDLIVEQDEPGDEFFIISDGAVRVERDGKFVSTLGEGKYFGEIALLTSKKRQATVTADSDDVKVLTVHRKVFQRVLGPLADILGRNMEAYSSLLMQ